MEHEKKKLDKELREEWAESFLERLDNLKDSDSDPIEIVLGDAKRNHGRKYVVSKCHLEDIMSYIKFLKLKGVVISESAAKHANLLIYLANFIRKPFKEYKRKDIEDFLFKYEKYSNSYKSCLKIVMKSFFRWLYGFEKDEGYPDLVKWIEVRNRDNSRLPEILTQEEITKLLNSADNLRDRAIIHILYDSGCRAGEILSIRLQNLTFDEYGGIINVNGKTGSRRVRLISCVPDLKAWLNVHMDKDNPQAPLFYSITSNNYGKPLSDSSLGMIVQKTAKKAKIGRRIHCHLFRHTNATHWAKYLKEPEMRIRYGWAKNSDMTSLYVHLSGEDVDDKILAASGLKELGENSKTVPRIPPKICTRCNEENPSANKFCQKCSYPLDIEAVNQIDTIKQVINEFLVSKLLQKPEFMEELPKLVEEWSKTKK